MATVRKKVDNRIRVQIENGVALHHRSLFVVVGDHGRDQVTLDSSACSSCSYTNTHVEFRGTSACSMVCAGDLIGCCALENTSKVLVEIFLEMVTIDLLTWVSALDAVSSYRTLHIVINNIIKCQLYSRMHGYVRSLFIFKLNDLVWQEHLDYEIIQSLNPEFNKAVVRVNIFKEHRQTIQVHACLIVFGASCCFSLASDFRYYVNRDTLFCYHKASEAFLQRLMALYVASHYKNSPNDLQLLSDAPAHHLFCLLPPVSPTHNSLPEVLAVVQVCLEGEISRQSILNSLSRGKKASGDLIPWTVSEQFQDAEFGGLSGGRVVRIAVNPDYQGMGYGSRALQLLELYYKGQFPVLDERERPTASKITSVSSEAVSLLEEVVSPRTDLPPLLLKLSERTAERLDYLGVSYGLTPQLLKFWKKAGFVPVYLRQTPNDLTGEHSCVMLKELNTEDSEGQWLPAFWKDFRRRFLSLLSYQFSSFSSPLALNILQNKKIKDDSPAALNSGELAAQFTPYDLKRLEMYSRNMVDYHLIMDMVPAVARMFFLKQLGDISLSAAQSALLLGVGLQHKTVDDLEKEIELPSSQLMGLFNRLIRKVVQVRALRCQRHIVTKEQERHSLSYKDKALGAG
uniref:N-acetyltransferase 10 n=1 Tax=Astyanax mexicanus TaxID=7994 RepID=A0A8B9H9A8_ASTMX